MLPDATFELTTRQIKAIRGLQWKAKKQGDCRLLLRCQGVLMLQKGIARAVVADVLHVHLNSVKGWVKRVRQHGVPGLLDREYPGAEPKLRLDQQETLKKAVAEGPEKAGFDTGVWTSPLVKEFIRREFGVIYHVSQVRRILNRLGFSFQYPRIRLSKGDIVKQREWLETTLPEIKKKSKRKTES